MDISQLNIDDIVVARCYFQKRNKTSSSNEFEYNSGRYFVVEDIDYTDNSCILRSISSKKHSYSYEIQDFNTTNLTIDPSYIHCTPYNLVNMLPGDIDRKVGELSSKDAEGYIIDTIKHSGYQLDNIIISVRERLEINRRRKMYQDRDR